MRMEKNDFLCWRVQMIMEWEIPSTVYYKIKDTELFQSKKGD